MNRDAALQGLPVSAPVVPEERLSGFLEVLSLPVFQNSVMEQVRLSDPLASLQGGAPR